MDFFVERYGELRETYPGWTLVLFDGEIVASDPDAARAMEQAREKGYDPAECLVQIVPAPGQSYFF